MTRVLWHRVRGKLTRSQWWRFGLLGWLLSVLWIVMGVLLAVYWDRWPWWGKGLAGLYMIAVYPQPSVLFRSYKRYEEDWERENPQGQKFETLQPAEVRMRKERAGRLLRDVASGSCAADHAISQWPFHTDERQRDVAEALHTLAHFAADADIRAKDSNYSEHTRAQLVEMAKRLEEGR